MRKIGYVCLLLFAFVAPVFADSQLTLEQFLRGYLGTVVKLTTVPDSYEYIQLKYKNIDENSPLYTTLKKAVYLDLFPNARIELPLNQLLNQKQVTTFMQRGFSWIETGDMNLPAQMEWFTSIMGTVVGRLDSKTRFTSTQSNPVADSPLLEDIYARLKLKYVSTSGLNEKAMIYGSIQGMVDSLKDPYTTFFPPTDAKTFSDELQGEYYGIGAYVQMEKPGEMIIVAPMKDSPAEKAGFKAGDRILQVNDSLVTSDISLNVATSWIKGPAGTTVTLKILRDGKTLTITATRAKVVIKNVDTKIVGTAPNRACIVSLRQFDFGVATDFFQAMNQLAGVSCKKYIFDVRNNPGGSLEEVYRMLNYFVPMGEPSIIIKSRYLTETMPAGDAAQKLTGAVVRVLINKGSASASEIFAGTIKDYVSHALLVGENTFGKGSVQELLDYDDGSMLKYTIAKWYTGKNPDKSIDKIGYAPDVKIVDNTGTVADDVLEWAVRN